MYLDNDYIKTDKNIWGVKGNWYDTSSKILVKLVYSKDYSGKYIKKVDEPGKKGEAFYWIDPNSGEHISSRFTEGLITLEPDSRWMLMWEALKNIGVSDNEIGYFGSKRLNFPRYKDVDFIVYGKNAHSLVNKNIHKIKQQCLAYNITQEHITYQIATHAKYYDHNINSFKNLLSNKWSSCMFSYGLCSTIRFVDPENNTGPLLKQIFDISSSPEKFTGIAINTNDTSFFPRQFTLLTAQAEFKVIIPLWIYHQCVKENDLVEITGVRNSNLIVIKDYTHGIRIL